jgi:hypothetical protein
MKAGLKCKYDQETKGCVDALPSDGCGTMGLNREGCMSITSEACIWKSVNYAAFNIVGDFCVRNEILSGLTSCVEWPDQDGT